MQIEVRVATGAKEERVEEISEGIYKVWVKAQPEKNKANHAIIKVLSTFFDVPLTRVRIVSGTKSRHKQIVIEDLQGF